MEETRGVVGGGGDGATTGVEMVALIGFATGVLFSVFILVFGCLAATGVLVFILACLATGVRAGESSPANKSF